MSRDVLFPAPYLRLLALRIEEQPELDGLHARAQAAALGVADVHALAMGAGYLAARPCFLSTLTSSPAASADGVSTEINPSAGGSAR